MLVAFQSRVLLPPTTPTQLMVDDSATQRPRSRRKTIRDLLVFQVKLWMEGFKDVVLVPLSLGAATIDLLLGKKTGRGALYGVMRVGNRFEEWIDLYGALDRAETPAPGTGSVELSSDGDLTQAEVDSTDADAGRESSPPPDSRIRAQG